jgi:hypothetical protein
MGLLAGLLPIKPPQVIDADQKTDPGKDQISNP